MLSPDESSIDEAEYKLVSVVTQQNRKDLQIQMFPNVKIDFEQLFDGID